MAGNKNGSMALQSVMQGKKVTETQAKSALGSAVGRIATLGRRAGKSKEAMEETGTLVLHTAETQGSLFLSSMAEGYFGEDRLKVGSVDVRAPLALLAQGYGLYQAITGQKGAGAHVLALGNGVMGSWLSSVARNAGKLLASRQKATTAETPTSPANTAPSVPPPVVVMQGAGLLPEPGVAGPFREVLLTPERRERRDAPRRSRNQRDRFVRAAHNDIDDE